MKIFENVPIFNITYILFTPKKFIRFFTNEISAKYDFEIFIIFTFEVQNSCKL